MILWSDLAWATHKGLGLCRCGPLPRRTGATEPVRFQRAVRVCAVSLQGTAPVGIRRVRARGAGPEAESLGRPGNATVRHIGCRGQAGRAGALHLAPPAVGEPARVFARQHAEFPMATAPDKGV